MPQIVYQNTILIIGYNDLKQIKSAENPLMQLFQFKMCIFSYYMYDPCHQLASSESGPVLGVYTV